VTQQINLYQQEFRREEKKYSFRTLTQAVAIMAVAIVLIYGVLAWRINTMRTEVEAVEARQEVVTRQLEDAKQKFATRPKDEQLESRVLRLERVVAARNRVREAMQRGMFTNISGYSGYLTSLARQHLSGMWLTDIYVSGGGDEVRLMGRSREPELVPRFIQRLAKEQGFENTRFTVFQMNRPELDKQAASYVEFVVRTTGAPEPEAKKE
jgi:Tfp pilus assembly protein PilN